MSIEGEEDKVQFESLIKHAEKNFDLPVSERIPLLHQILSLYIKLCNSNEDLRIQYISKYLPIFIFANEELQHFNDFSAKNECDCFLKRIPMSVVMKEMLLLIGGFGLSEGKIESPAWFVTSISKKLSESLASPNGLSSLLRCLDDLGGDSFWNNSVAMASVATLLSTKPQCSESYQKYALSMFSQFLDIMKNSKFGSNVSLLFVLTIDKLHAKAPKVIEIQLVDKILRPWELLLERGIQNTSSKENGYWNASLDGSIVILKSWLNAQPQHYNFKHFTFSHRFFKLIPLFMHLCGQASTVEELKEFSVDLSLILTRLLGEDFKKPEMVIKNMFDDGGKTHGFFKISHEKKSLISEVKEGLLALKYPVNLEIIEDCMDEEMMIDLKVDAFRLITKNLSTESALKSITVLMSDCLNAWVNSNDVVVLEEDTVRFVPELEDRVAEHSRKIKAVYILGSVIDILISIETESFSNDVLTDMVKIARTIFVNAVQKLSAVVDIHVLNEQNKDLNVIEAQTVDLAVGLVSAIVANGMNDENLKFRLQEVGKEMNIFCATYNKLQNQHFIDLYKMAYENSNQILELFSNDLHLDLLSNTTDERHKKPVIGSEASKHYAKKIQEWQGCLEDDNEEAVKGGILIEISRALRLKDKTIFSNADDFECIWKMAFSNASHHDSYVFLASINVLAELAYWQTEIYLPRLLESFIDWDGTSLSNDASLIWRCKLGEALAKVFKQIGNYSTFYFDRFSNSLLHLTKNGDELIRSSAISSFADLVLSCRGRKFDSTIQELLLLVSQYLKTDDSAIVRRSTIHLLRCLLTSAEDSLLTIFADTIRDIHRMLKRLWLHDLDEVVRFHAELALIDLKSIIQRLFENM